ncbi:GL10232, related [Eimeria praecox]|uniref:GL10232, related n=1 Tax=Eimeria praecox TaxID=51316 RepID=U6GXQ8_9EIME|nr:GL10232, related [Eimeria praecox]
MEYLLPLEYTQQLKRLQCNLPPSPMAQVEAVLKHELKIDRLNEIFQEFEETPVGAASLAQVHFAVLTNGQPVAVKVQHADVRELAEMDTRVVELLTGVAGKIFPEVRLEWLVDLLRKNLPTELDFRKEAENANKCRELLQGGGSTFHFVLPQPSLLRSVLIRLAARVASWFWLPNPHLHFGDNNDPHLSGRPPTLPGSLESARESTLLVTDEQQPHSRAPQVHPGSASASTFHKQHGNSHCISDYEVELYVPRVYNNLTTARVLVMERCKGVPVDDLEGIVSQGIHPLAVSEALSELYGRLIFDLGFVHADPHPGNVIVHLDKSSYPTWPPRAVAEATQTFLMYIAEDEKLVAVLQLRAIQGRLGIDEALVLLPLLYRAVALVGKNELQELTQLKAPTLQVLHSRWRLWKEKARLRCAEQLLRVRSMNWDTPTGMAIDHLCSTF